MRCVVLLIPVKPPNVSDVTRGMERRIDKRVVGGWPNLGDFMDERRVNAATTRLE
jgi:hypothetical protein